MVRKCANLTSKGLEHNPMHEKAFDEVTAICLDQRGQSKSRKLNLWPGVVLVES